MKCHGFQGGQMQPSVCIWCGQEREKHEPSGVTDPKQRVEMFKKMREISIGACDDRRRGGKMKGLEINEMVEHCQSIERRMREDGNLERAAYWQGVWHGMRDAQILLRPPVDIPTEAK